MHTHNTGSPEHDKFISFFNTNKNDLQKLCNMNFFFCQFTVEMLGNSSILFYYVILIFTGKHLVGG
jgi:vomeronasal1 receptor